MGCVSSSEGKVQQVKLLLQGTGGCGKSTFAKQMKIIHGCTFSDEELRYFKNALGVNVALGLKSLAEFAETNGKTLKKDLKKFIEDVNPYSFGWTKEAAEKAKQLYEDPAIKYAKENFKCEFEESLDYAILRLDKLLDPEWKPANEDILYARGRTSGVQETVFTTGSLEWHLIDVGGQTAERRKWSNLHNDIQGVLYFAAVDEYDIPSEEAEGMSKFQVSLSVWEEIIHQPAIAGQVPIILFLNKADLLEKRLKKSSKSLKRVFKNYNGGKDTNSALEFLKQEFLSKIQDGSGVDRNQIYVHNTCALDTQQMNIVFNSVRDFVTQRRMQLGGLL